jgi:hypothetical protein
MFPSAYTSFRRQTIDLPARWGQACDKGGKDFVQNGTCNPSDWSCENEAAPTEMAVRRVLEC